MSGGDREVAVAFIMPNKDTATDFLLWMSNEGEQLYWEAMEMNDKPLVSFDYKFDGLGVMCQLMEPEE